MIVGRTVGSHTVELGLIVLRTVMRGSLEVIAAERFLTVLALEWKKIDEETSLGRALFPDGEYVGLAFLGRVWG